MSASREKEKRRGGGLSIGGRFSLFMTLALLVVMSAAGYFLLQKSRDALARANRKFIDETVRLTVREDDARTADLESLFEQVKLGLFSPAEGLKRLREAGEGKTYKALDTGMESESVVRRDIAFLEDSRRGLLVSFGGRGNLVAPADVYGGQHDSLFGLILVASAAVIAVGAVVALVVSSQVTKPIELLVNDVRQISLGNLHHRTRVKGGGEVFHLARQIDRMAQSLEEAQETEIELSVREREREVAHEVHEALLPAGAPQLAGYTLADVREDAADPGGDFHDFVETGGRLSVLMCEVSGRGVPGALVGATARAYLRSELERGTELGEALRRVNRQVAHDMRRGMYVTALCVQLEPDSGSVQVACAGHKMPLVRYEAASRTVKLIQPNGFALGFDKGPVFDRGLEVVRVSLAAGDRLVLATTGPAQVVDPEGGELGEKGFYRLVSRAAVVPPDKQVRAILAGLQEHAQGEAFPADVSLVVIAREA